MGRIMTDRKKGSFTIGRRSTLRGLTLSVVLGGIALGAAGQTQHERSADLPSLEAGAEPAPFDAGRSSFVVAYQGMKVPYRVFLLPALPGEEVRVRVLDPGPASSGGPEGSDRPGRGRATDAPGYTLHADGGTVRRRGPRSWRWTAPHEAGRRLRLVVREVSSGDSVVLNTFVLVPARRIQDGRLEGYRLGTFPTPAYRGLAQYHPPQGYIQLTRDLVDVRVSPHFTLGQFPCKRPHGYPKYLPVGPRMLLKLERMLEELNEQGIRARGFHVMSSHRSPWYNTDLLGRPRYSRHIYGDAADVFVDEDGNGYMDDLNGDGRITIRDAEVLFRIADRIDREEGGNPLTGGLWKYHTTDNHPPFVHVDTRGFVAR